MKIRENATFVLLSEVFFDSKSISKHSLTNFLDFGSIWSQFEALLNPIFQS